MKLESLVVDDNPVLIMDSDSIDTFEDLTSFTDIIEDNIFELDSIDNDNEKNNLNDIIMDDSNDEEFELLCLNSVSSDIGIDTYFNNTNNNTQPTKNEAEYNELELLLSPIDLLNSLMELKCSTQNTLQKLKLLQMKCEKAILDIEHSLEFEEFNVTEGYGKALLIKELRMKRRVIKDTLDKYESIKPIVDSLDRNFSNRFIKSQLKSLNKTEQTQSSRVYTPRILKNLDISKKPVDTNKITNLEEEVDNILYKADIIIKANSL